MTGEETALSTIESCWAPEEAENSAEFFVLET